MRFDRQAWAPPEDLTLSEWAARHYYLSAESSAEPGKWRPYPYQVGIMDALSDPNIEQVTFKKSARVGATKILNALIGYYMHQDPCAIMVVQPTVESAEIYSKEEVAPMLRDCPVLARMFAETATGGGRARTSSDTILHKIYPGGSVSMVGANSGRGFRSVTRKVVACDEVDAYPSSAGSEGDPFALAKMRTFTFHDRKIYACSTPVTDGESRIDELFLSGDQRFFLVPCPHCGTFDRLVWGKDDEDGGHYFSWPKGSPQLAHFVCSSCGDDITHAHKFNMVSAGHWQATAESQGHASFHIWAAYSLSPNASWEALAREYEAAEAAGPMKIKAYVNLVRGETWQAKGDAPDWELLYGRREPYQPGVVPVGARFLTAGVDVQKDRFYVEVVAWGDNKESWSIEAMPLYGNTALDETWQQLDELLTRHYPGADGAAHRISCLAVDSGAFTQTVYNWARKHPLDRVMAVKGVHTARMLLGKPSEVDVTHRGRRLGYKLWPVGVSIAKSELYGWLRLEPWQAGYCHFPEYGDEYFKQLTSEHLLEVVNKRGFVEYQWRVLPNRENHFLDCRVYARAAASRMQIDRMVQPAPRPAANINANALAEPRPQAENRRQMPAKQGLPNKGGWLQNKGRWLG